MVNEAAEVSEAKRLAEDMGRRVLYAREARELTTTELGARAGVDEAAIRHIEKGRRGPSVPLIATLCHILHITPQYLFYGDVEGIAPDLKATLLQKHPELKWPSLPRPAGKWNKSRKGSLKRTRTRPRMELSEN